MNIIARIIAHFRRPVCTELFGRNHFDTNPRYAERVFRVNGAGVSTLPLQNTSHPIDPELRAGEIQIVRAGLWTAIVRVPYEPRSMRITA